jgi:hypothetical protein
MPAHQTGDLMLAFAIYDAGAAVWTTTISGWNHWFTQANGTSTSVVAFWRYAASSADADITIAHTSTADTLTACVVSVRDAFAGYTAGAGAPAHSTSAQAASTRFAMPTVTTPEHNCLLLHFLGTTATGGGVHFVENAAHELVVIDGAAEGLGLGWVFQKVQGVSAANIYACSNVTGVGVKSVMTIRPPAGGAQVIPPYCVSDASIYLNPNGGTAAWDGCTQLAAATTSFGTSLNGKTSNATGTVAAVVDIGVNSYHSFMGLTNAATANAVSAAELTMGVGRYGIGTRNILGHFRHTTPANNQRLTALSTGRGVWFGMKSGGTAAANYKVWQVHGSDVPIVAGAIQPFVVNAANTDTIASNSTIDTADVRKYGWWTGGVGTLTNQACLGPMWAMDTLVMAGGTASEPITIPDIVNVAATAKERLSSQLQGSNQMLCLQTIMFGDGGTNPVNLKISGGAVEFPSKKNVAKKTVNYNGSDNSVGFIFYPGDGDTIDLGGSSFTSTSKFVWNFVAGSSATANYNLVGVVVNGAGACVLRSVVPADQVTFANCSTVYTNGATITNSSFSNSTAIVDTPTNAAKISDTSFAKTTGTSHGMQIGSAGAVPSSPATITLSNVTFTGYAAYQAGGTSTGDEAINVLYTSGTLNIYASGSPSYKTAGATVNIISGATVTFTGMPTGCDIVILTSGTSTILQQIDAHGSTSYGWGYSGTPTVDVGFIKPGYVPYYIRNLTLGSTDSSIPVSLTIDRNYQA